MRRSIAPHSAKGRRSRIFNKDKLSMRDEIIVAGDEGDTKRQSSQEQRPSSSELYLDDIAIPPPETSDRHAIPPDGEDTLSSGWSTPQPEESGSAIMPPPGWPSDGQRRWNLLQRQIGSTTPVPGHNQTEGSSFLRLFARITNDDSPSEASSSMESLQDGIRPSRGRAFTNQSAKQILVGKRSQKRTRKRASRDDHDQEGDSLMREADTVAKKQEDNRPWACPFFRKDPTRHMDCITLTLNRIQDVKQHLARRHTADFSCSVCFEEFRHRQDWEEHVRLRACSERPPPPHRVSPKTQDRLKVRVDRTLTASEQWYEIWRILFEDEKLPHRPQQGSVIGEVIGIIRDCWQADRGQILSELIRSEGISETEAGYLGVLLGVLLDQVQDRVDPVQHDSRATDAPSKAEGSTPYMAEKTGQSVGIGKSGLLPSARRHGAAPKLSTCPSPSPPTTPILPDISTSNFQPLKLEQFAYDPSPQQHSFDRLMEQHYSTSAEDNELFAMTLGSQLEGDCPGARGLQNGYDYMDPMLDFAPTFATNNWVQYPGQLDIFDGNDVNGEPVLQQPFDHLNARHADMPPIVGIDDASVGPKAKEHNDKHMAASKPNASLPTIVNQPLKRRQNDGPGGH